jgi:hypothetical protein
MEEIKKPTFEEKYEEIHTLIQRRRYKWQLKGISSLDFDDIIQIILLHIFVKWEQYNPSLPLPQWVNKIISSQLINLTRNNFYKFARPCLRCAFNKNSDDSCEYTKSKIQDSSCIVYKKWEQKKKSSYDINLALPMANHENEVNSLPGQNCNLERAIQEFHEKMKLVLTKTEYKVYDLLFIQKVTEVEAAKEMGYKTSESCRKVGYNNFLRFKKRIMEKAKKVKDEIDFY